MKQLPFYYPFKKDLQVEAVRVLMQEIKTDKGIKVTNLEMYIKFGHLQLHVTIIFFANAEPKKLYICNV